MKATDLTELDVLNLGRLIDDRLDVLQMRFRSETEPTSLSQIAAEYNQLSELSSKILLK